MLRFASIVALASVSLLAASAPYLAQAQVPANGKIPALASAEFAWLALGVNWLDPPPGLGRGPIKQDPDHPFHGNRDGPAR